MRVCKFFELNMIWSGGGERGIETKDHEGGCPFGWPAGEGRRSHRPCWNLHDYTLVLSYAKGIEGCPGENLLDWHGGDKWRKKEDSTGDSCRPETVVEMLSSMGTVSRGMTYQQWAKQTGYVSPRALSAGTERGGA